MALSYLCKLAEGTFNVPSANLHNRFWAAGSSSCEILDPKHMASKGSMLGVPVGPHSLLGKMPDTTPG